MSYVSLMFCFVCPARTRPQGNEAKVTKNILHIGQNEAKHKSLMLCFVFQQTDLIGQLDTALARMKLLREISLYMCTKK